MWEGDSVRRWAGVKRVIHNMLALKHFNVPDGIEARFIGIEQKSRGHFPQKGRSVFVQKHENIFLKEKGLCLN